MATRKLLAFAFAACAALAPTARADVAEFNNCTSIPQEIKFSRENTTIGQVTRRFEKYAGGDWILLPKNPEVVYDHGPLHGRNCTPGSIVSGTQVLTFRMKTTNWFGMPWVWPRTAAGNHFAVLMRGQLVRANYDASVGTQKGKGLALFPFVLGGFAQGGQVEFFSESSRLEPMNDGYFDDDTWYNFVIHVHQYGIAYWVRNLTTTVQVYGYHQSFNVLTPDTGYGFGALCNDWICEGTTPNFEIHIKDITMSWFQQ